MKANLTINMDSIGEYSNFIDAFTEMYNQIKKFMTEGYSWQALETTNWIEITDDKSEIMVGVMDFYHARDYACKIGLLTNGKLTPENVKNKEEIDLAWDIILRQMNTTII